VTLTVVVALTLAACGLGTTESTTTTEDTRGWSEEAFRDLMAYCQEVSGSGCATFIIDLRDIGQCSAEATYRIIDDLKTIRASSFALRALVEGVLQPAGDCLGYGFPDE